MDDGTEGAADTERVELIGLSGRDGASDCAPDRGERFSFVLGRFPSDSDPLSASSSG